jgi:hypothetical protein
MELYDISISITDVNLKITLCMQLYKAHFILSNRINVFHSCLIQFIFLPHFSASEVYFLRICLHEFTMHYV